jgi:tRNA pseudouridine55 synthase
VLEGNPAHQGLMLALDGETPVALVEGSDTGICVVRGFNL